MRKIQNGQALITLLFIALIAISITTAAVVMMVVTVGGSANLQQGELAYEVAKTGEEEALLRLLRDPNYGGEGSFLVGSNWVKIEVIKAGPSSNPSYTINTTAHVGNFIRKIQKMASYNNNVLTVTSEKEIF